MITAIVRNTKDQYSYACGRGHVDNVIFRYPQLKAFNARPCAKRKNFGQAIIELCGINDIQRLITLVGHDVIVGVTPQGLSIEIYDDYRE